MEESHKYKESDHNNDVLLLNLKKKQAWGLSMLIWYRNNSASRDRMLLLGPASSIVYSRESDFYETRGEVEEAWDERCDMTCVWFEKTG